MINAEGHSVFPRHYSDLGGRGEHNLLHAKVAGLVKKAEDEPRNASIHIDLTKAMTDLGLSAEKEELTPLEISAHQEQAIAPYNEIMQNHGIKKLHIDPKTTEPEVPDQTADSNTPQA